MAQSGKMIGGDSRKHDGAVRKVLEVGEQVWSSGDDQKIIIWHGVVRVCSLLDLHEEQEQEEPMIMMGRGDSIGKTDCWGCVGRTENHEDARDQCVSHIGDRRHEVEHDEQASVVRVSRWIDHSVAGSFSLVLSRSLSLVVAREWV